MLDGLRLPVYGADDGAALRDILFTWWEQKFLGAAESGAPAISRLAGIESAKHGRAASADVEERLGVRPAAGCRRSAKLRG